MVWCFVTLKVIRNDKNKNPCGVDVFPVIKLGKEDELFLSFLLVRISLWLCGWICVDVNLWEGAHNGEGYACDKDYFFCFVYIGIFSHAIFIKFFFYFCNIISDFGVCFLYVFLLLNFYLTFVTPYTT